MSDFTTEQLASLRDGTAPTSGSLKSAWNNAPRITKTTKVTAPSAIRSSHEGGELIQIKQIAGPSAASIAAGQRKDEEERRASAQAEAARLALLDDASPSKVQARLAYLEREVKKLTKLVKELSHG